MCGISGFSAATEAIQGSFGFERSQDQLRLMNDLMHHRGPDDSGYFSEKKTHLGMRRLSIIDVDGGHQPIFSQDKQTVIVFNGEIYNYPTLRKSLEESGIRFATKTDTEVVLKLYELHQEKCLRFLEGMFTLAIYHRPSEKLFLARDRLGVKPLYYSLQNGWLAFASEMKSLLALPWIERKVYTPAIDAYLAYRYVPGPATLIEGIHKFPPAHFGYFEKGKLKLEGYWSPYAEKSTVSPVSLSNDSDTIQNQFNSLFEASVKKRMIADVPLGAFLSGGLDSSAIVAAMAKFSPEPIKTFSIGFDWNQNELPDAKQVADFLKCDHQEILCTQEDMGLLPQLIWHLDEPVGDAIILPMYLLSKAAQKSVKVILSGEGADEVLGGYFPHRILYWTHHYQQLLPRFLRSKVILPLTRNLPAQFLSHAFDYPAQLGELGKRKLVEYLSGIERSGLYQNYESIISLFKLKDRVQLYDGPILNQLGLEQTANPRSVPYYDHQDSPFGKRANVLEDILSLQYGHWLPDDILTKQDKMTMANSVEGREPFMDHHLVEFLSSVPQKFKISHSQNKILLRTYLSTVLPRKIAQRKKKAFYIPVERYLQSSRLRELSRSSFDPHSISKRGIFKPSKIKEIETGLQQGEFIRDKQYFSLLCLEIWFRIFIDREKGLF